jgi:hypothetical protein
MSMRRARRSLQFESLEQRVAMSAGLTGAAGVRAAAHTVPVAGTFTGGSTSLAPGNILGVGGLSGELGKVQFEGSVGGQISGHRFESGFIQLSNSKGTLVADVGRGTLRGKGPALLRLLVVVTQATGNYASVAGAVGTARFQFRAEQTASLIKKESVTGDWYPQAVEFTVHLANLNLKADQALL